MKGSCLLSSLVTLSSLVGSSYAESCNFGYFLAGSYGFPFVEDYCQNVFLPAPISPTGMDFEASYEFSCTAGVGSVDTYDSIGCNGNPVDTSAPFYSDCSSTSDDCDYVYLKTPFYNATTFSLDITFPGFPNNSTFSFGNGTNTGTYPSNYTFPSFPSNSTYGSTSNYTYTGPSFPSNYTYGGTYNINGTSNDTFGLGDLFGDILDAFSSLCVNKTDDDAIGYLYDFAFLDLIDECAAIVPGFLSADMSYDDRFFNATIYSNSGDCDSDKNDTSVFPFLLTCSVFTETDPVTNQSVLYPYQTSIAFELDEDDEPSTTEPSTTEFEDDGDDSGDDSEGGGEAGEDDSNTVMPQSNTTEFMDMNATMDDGSGNDSDGSAPGDTEMGSMTQLNYYLFAMVSLFAIVPLFG